MANETCACKGGQALIFGCSGGSDVGALADLAARRLSKEGKGKMYCLAGVGGRVPGIMKTTEATEEILAIDGCPMECAKKTLEQAGIKKFKHLQLAGLGFEKGKAPGSEENVSKAAAAGAGMLGSCGGCNA